VLVIVWEFRVKAGRKAEFEQRYGPRGDWAQLFRRSPAYRGTDLLRDTADANRYLTLDRECEALTESERCLGWFEIQHKR